MKRPVLLYNISPANGGLVFATRQRAAFISRIHDAVSGSRTWAEFRRATPGAEYSRITEGREPRPRGSDPFSSDEVPGYGDGDYPPWLQQEMESVLPAEVLEQFGKGEMTMLNGGYIHIE